MTERNMAAVAYYTNLSGVETGVAEQAEACHAYAAAELRVDIIEEFLDVGLADAARPDLRRLMRRIHEFPVDYMIVSDLARLRSDAQGAARWDCILLTGTKVAAVRDNAVVKMRLGLPPDGQPAAVTAAMSAPDDVE